jgi:hypothetical protein
VSEVVDVPPSPWQCLLEEILTGFTLSVRKLHQEAEQGRAVGGVQRTDPSVFGLSCKYSP